MQCIISRQLTKSSQSNCIIQNTTVIVWALHTYVYCFHFKLRCSNVSDQRLPSRQLGKNFEDDNALPCQRLTTLRSHARMIWNHHVYCCNFQVNCCTNPTHSMHVNTGSWVSNITIRMSTALQCIHMYQVIVRPQLISHNSIYIYICAMVHVRLDVKTWIHARRILCSEQQTLLYQSIVMSSCKLHSMDRCCAKELNQP